MFGDNLNIPFTVDQYIRGFNISRFLLVQLKLVADSKEIVEQVEYLSLLEQHIQLNSVVDLELEIKREVWEPNLYCLRVTFKF